MIKAIFFDIDGTLVPFGAGAVPEEVACAISHVRRCGIKVFVATGRHIDWVDNLGDIEFDGYLTANGSICLESDRKTCFFSHGIPDADIDRLISFAPRCPLPVVVVPEAGGHFITRIDDNVLKVADLLKVPPLQVRPLEEARGRKVVQLMVFGSEKERKESGIFDSVLLESEATSWNPLFCDVVPRGIDKGVGIDMMLRHFGIRLCDSVAFGDGGNDIAMLRHAGIGVAMGQSAPDVKSAADLITDPVDRHGVVNAFRLMGLLS